MRFRYLVPLVALLPLAHVACVGDDPTPGSSGAAGEDGGASGNDGGTGSSSSSSGGGDASSDAPVAISKVSGVVVSDVGTPVVGAIVRVEGRPESVTTGADGKFSLDAPPTYDLTVAYPSNGTTSGSAVIAVLGLTTRAPSIEVV
ncbi:MAG: carboxypeptidase regulatory-like domain-containing protein, partial [Myxococcales bacterium]|nr:carboxypeptidase regulatory-like domain-containing protein [Myxococcales bacterium]